MEDMYEAFVWLLQPLKPARGSWSLLVQVVNLVYQETEKTVDQWKPGAVFKFFCCMLVLMVSPFVVCYHAYKDLVCCIRYFRKYRLQYRMMLQTQPHLWNSQSHRLRTMRSRQLRLLMEIGKALVCAFFQIYWRLLQNLPEMFRQPKQLRLPI